MDDHDITWEQLVAYASGELDDRDRTELDVRLTASPALARQAGRLRELIGTMTSDQSAPPTERALARARALTSRSPADVWGDWLRAAQKIVAELIFDSRDPAVLAGLRGDPLARHLAFKSAVGRLDVHIAPPEQYRHHWRVRGQAQGVGDRGTALLLSPGTDEVIVCAELDDTGQFKLEATSGRYDLGIAVDATAGLLVYGLEFGDEAAG